LKSNRVRNFPFWELINIAQTRHLTCGIGGTVRSFLGLVGVKEDRSKLQARGLSNLLTIVAAALILITASHNSHAQSLVGIATSAADNTAVQGASGNAISIAPPSNMLAGDLVLVFAQYRNASGPTEDVWTLTDTGGQGWSNDLQNISVGIGNLANNTGGPFWCRFNGAWSENPTFTPTNGSDNVPADLIMVVVRPDTATDYWIPDVGPAWAVPATGNTVTARGLTTGFARTVTFAVWQQASVHTWSDLTGSGWSQANLSPQYRNIAGDGQTMALAYNIRTTAGPVDDVSLTQSGTADATATWVMSFGEVALPSGGGTGTAGQIDVGTFASVGQSLSNMTVSFSRDGVADGHAVLGLTTFECAAQEYVPGNGGISDNAAGQSNSYYPLAQYASSTFTQKMILFAAFNVTGGPSSVTITNGTGSSLIVETATLVDRDDVAGIDPSYTPSTEWILGRGLVGQDYSSGPDTAPSQSNSYLFGAMSLPGVGGTFVLQDDWTEVTHYTSTSGGAVTMVAGSKQGGEPAIATLPRALHMIEGDAAIQSGDVIGVMAVFKPGTGQ